jgi:cobalt/nickel transport system permease protein
VTLAYRDPAISNSPPARWDTRWKLAAMLVFVVAVAFLRTLTPLGVALGIAIGLLALARVSVSVVLARSSLLLLAVAPFVVVLPIFVENGWPIAAAVSLRCLTIGLVGLFLLHTATVADTLAAARTLGVPGTLVMIAQLAYRYALTLFGEARRLRIAMISRGFRVRTTGHTYRSLGHAAGALLVSGGERAERVAAAMKARGFDGTPRSLDLFRTRAADVLAFAAVVVVSAALLAWEYAS